MRLAIDTNVLAYADRVGQSEGDLNKATKALHLLHTLNTKAIRPVIALQSLAELYQVLTRKLGLTGAEAQARVVDWRDLGEAVGTCEETLDVALELASYHKLQIYDAIIMAAVVEADCDLLLSEDMQDGFAWRGLVVANPFAATLEPRLARLLA